ASALVGLREILLLDAPGAAGERRDALLGRVEVLVAGARQADPLLEQAQRLLEGHLSRLELPDPLLELAELVLEAVAHPSSTRRSRSTRSSRKVRRSPSPRSSATSTGASDLK